VEEHLGEQKKRGAERDIGNKIHPGRLLFHFCLKNKTAFIGSFSNDAVG